MGAIGGGRLTGDVLSFPSPEANGLSAGSAFRLESRFYDVGPMIEMDLTHGLAVEFDALYHRQGFFYTFYHSTQNYTSRERENSWEFPLLLKYRRRFSVLNPFIQGGVAARTMSGGFGSDAGFIAGGGLEFNRGRLRLAPQFRYARWATAPVSGLYYSLGSIYSSNQNQVDVLVGIVWKVN